VKVQTGTAPAQTLSEPYQRLVVRANTSTALDSTTATAVRKEFPALFSAMPPTSTRSVLLFQPRGTDLTAESVTLMLEIRDKALRRSGAELVVIGHTDTVGSQASNDALSLRRAQQIRDLYIQGGFPAARIEAVGRGERELAVPTPDETSEPRNRRVEILLR
jgi:outer membrane protein OmpA-like peptidoglycan-associated protein